MVSARPRAGDLLVVRLNPDSAGILIVTADTVHRFHSPHDTVQDAIQHAREMATTSSVDVWHRTSPATFNLIASYRRDAGSQANH